MFIIFPKVIYDTGCAQLLSNRDWFTAWESDGLMDRMLDWGPKVFVLSGYHLVVHPCWFRRYIKGVHPKSHFLYRIRDCKQTVFLQGKRWLNNSVEYFFSGYRPEIEKEFAACHVVEWKLGYSFMRREMIMEFSQLRSDLDPYPLAETFVLT